MHTLASSANTPPCSLTHHLFAVLRGDLSTAHTCPADASADLVLLHPHGIGVDGINRDEPDNMLRVALEHAVDHDDGRAASALHSKGSTHLLPATVRKGSRAGVIGPNRALKPRPPAAAMARPPGTEERMLSIKRFRSWLASLPRSTLIR